MLLFALLVAAPLGPGTPALSLTLETGYLQPGGDSARGALAGLVLGYRVADQLSIVVGASQALLSVPRPELGRRETQPLTMMAAGLLGLLDATPVAPFLELTLVQLLPEKAAGYSLATRTALGADWRALPGFAVGLVVRTLTPLDSLGGVSPLGGTEIAARLVWVPGATR